MSRFRRFGANSDMLSYQFTEPGDPDDSLDLWWTSEKKPAPCLVATENTRQPMYVRHVQPGVRRMNNADEADRLMGYDAEDGSGISNG